MDGQSHLPTDPHTPEENASWISITSVSLEGVYYICKAFWVLKSWKLLHSSSSPLQIYSPALAFNCPTQSRVFPGIVFVNYQISYFAFM